jgi:hypothetical protein
MSAISLRLSESIHRQIRELAQREGISINQFISVAVAEKLSALLTDEYLGKRAFRGNRMKFEKALSKVKNAEPIQGDSIKRNG